MENTFEMYDSICRVCLKQCQPKNMVPLTNKPGKRSYLTYAKVLVKFAKISTKNVEILPTKICIGCKKMIENMYSFTIMCRNNDRKLQKFATLSKNDAEKCKAMVCDFTLFCQYFPTYSRSQAKNYSPEPFKLRSQVKELDKPNNSPDNDFNGDLSPSPNTEIIENDPSDMQNADSILDSIDKVVSKNYIKTIKQNNVDMMLDSIEMALNVKFKNHSFNSKIKDSTHARYPKCNTRTVQKRNFQCKNCNKVLANKNTFDYHIQQHTNYKFICDQCGKGYPGKDSLNRHLVTIHNMGSFIRCEQCSFKCSKRFELIEHVRIHTGERPFACDKCGLTFRRRAIWKIHQLHHQEKTKSCPVCQKKFFTSSQMQSHVNSIHLRLFFYSCHVCNTTFAKNGTVRKHLFLKHGIPREKQGKITRVARETNNSLFTDNK